MYICKKVDGSDNMYALCSFKEKPIRAAIHLNKFHNHVHAQRLLGSLLQTFLENRALNEPALLIPIPLSSKRERERGHNQVTSVILRCTLPEGQYVLEKNLLKKVRDTKPQTQLSKEERTKSPQGVYRCTDRAYTCIPGAHIILIDDVTTTGATLKEAQKTLKALKPASITCVALAH
jgi:ComF family protein